MIGRLKIFLVMLVLCGHSYGAVLESDDFNRADAASLGQDDQGHNWLYQDDFIAGISSKNAWINTTSTTSEVYNVAYIDSGEANVSVSIDLTGSIPLQTGPVLRIQDKDNFIFMEHNGSYLIIYKYASGYSFIGYELCSIATGDTMILRGDGDTISGYLIHPGSPNVTITATDASFDTETKHGMIFRWALPADNRIWMDNWSVSDISVPDTATPTETPVLSFTETATGTATATATITPTPFPTVCGTRFEMSIHHELIMKSDSHGTCVTRNNPADFGRSEIDGWVNFDQFESWLLWCDLSSIPPGSNITCAQLSIYCGQIVVDGPFVVYRILPANSYWYNVASCPSHDYMDNNTSTPWAGGFSSGCKVIGTDIDGLLGGVLAVF